MKKALTALVCLAATLALAVAATGDAPLTVHIKPGPTPAERIAVIEFDAPRRLAPGDVKLRENGKLITGVVQDPASRTVTHHVRFRTLAAPGSSPRVSIRIAGSGVGSSRFNVPDAPAGTAAAAASPEAIDAATVGLIALLAAAAGGVVWLILAPRRRMVGERVTDFVGQPLIHTPQARRTELRSRLRQSSRWQRWELDVELSGLDRDPRTLALMCGAVAAGVSWVMTASGHGPVALLALVGIPAVLVGFVRMRVRRCRKDFAEQLPDNLQLLASGLRAGHSLSGALANMVDRAAEPSRTELRRAVTDEQLGEAMDVALSKAARRMRCEELDYVGVVASVQRESGGNTAEVLDHVINTVRERQAVARLVRTLTAQGRFGGLVVSSMPVLLFTFISIARPDYMDPLTSSGGGKALLAAGAGMVVLGWVAIQRLVDIEP